MLSIRDCLDYCDLTDDEVAAFGAAGEYELTTGAAKCIVAGARIDRGNLSARFDGVSHRFASSIHGDRIVIHRHAPPGGRRRR